MDVAVKRRPQDGYYKFLASGGDRFDLRVSSLPTELGEKMVLRLFGSNTSAIQTGSPWIFSRRFESFIQCLPHAQWIDLGGWSNR